MNTFIIVLILVLGFIIGNIVLLKYMDKKDMAKQVEKSNQGDKD